MGGKSNIVLSEAAKVGRNVRYLKFRCEDLPITLIFRSVPRFEQMIFELEIDDEELRNKTDEFLIIIQGEQNRELGFENGQCIQDFSLDHLSFSLKSPDGTILNLTKLESEEG